MFYVLFLAKRKFCLPETWTCMGVFITDNLVGVKRLITLREVLFLEPTTIVQCNVLTYVW